MEILSIIQLKQRTVWPITVEECKRYCRFDMDIEDENFQMWIEQATDWMERWLGCKLIDDEMKMTVLCDRVNGYGSFEIPFGNIIVIESLFLGDMELEPDEYSVKGKEVTVPMDDHDTPVTIVFIAGYGKESIGVPAAIRSALLAMFNRNFNADAENQVKRIAQSFRVRKM